jgi:hypothetical protein
VLINANVVPSSRILSTLKLEAAYASETRDHVPEDGLLEGINESILEIKKRMRTDVSEGNLALILRIE